MTVQDRTHDADVESARRVFTFLKAEGQRRRGTEQEAVWLQLADHVRDHLLRRPADDPKGAA